MKKFFVVLLVSSSAFAMDQKDVFMMALLPDVCANQRNLEAVKKVALYQSFNGTARQIATSNLTFEQKREKIIGLLDWREQSKDGKEKKICSICPGCFMRTEVRFIKNPNSGLIVDTEEVKVPKTPEEILGRLEDHATCLEQRLEKLEHQQRLSKLFGFLCGKENWKNDT